MEIVEKYANVMAKITRRFERSSQRQVALIKYEQVLLNGLLELIYTNESKITVTYFPP